MTIMYRICWQRKDGGGQVHRGQPTEKVYPERWLAEMNEEHPDIEHWAEPVEVRTELCFPGDKPLELI